MADKFSDIITTALSLALAAGVMAFAAYKVVALNGMENPPANLGLNFPAPRRKVIMDVAPAADPLATRSLPEQTRAVQPGDGAEVLPAYELVTVIDGVAFLSVSNGRDRSLVPVALGSSLPDGRRVSAIRQHDGRWWLSAGDLTLKQSEWAAQ